MCKQSLTAISPDPEQSDSVRGSTVTVLDYFPAGCHKDLYLMLLLDFELIMTIDDNI